MLLRRLLPLLCPFLLLAQEDKAITAMLLRSAEDWNRGDLPAFASYYEDSAETTFVGRQVVRGGPDAILARYRRDYPTRDAMGALTFSEITVRTVAPDLAIVVGRYTLKRTAAGGGDATGRYSLVVRKGKAGWKIIHDHSSAL